MDIINFTDIAPLVSAVCCYSIAQLITGLQTWAIKLQTDLRGLSICHSDEPCMTAELIEMPFGLWTLVGPKNHVLDGVQIPHAKGQF